MRTSSAWTTCKGTQNQLLSHKHLTLLVCLTLIYIFIHSCSGASLRFLLASWMYKTTLSGKKPAVQWHSVPQTWPWPMAQLPPPKWISYTHPSTSLPYHTWVHFKYSCTPAGNYMQKCYNPSCAASIPNIWTSFINHQIIILTKLNTFTSYKIPVPLLVITYPL